MSTPINRFMTSRVNTFSDGVRVLALCQPCANILHPLWSHKGSPADRPGHGCDRCGVAQAELPGVPLAGWGDYVRRAVGGGHERLLAAAYVRSREPYGAGWGELFQDLAPLMVNGWTPAD